MSAKQQKKLKNNTPADYEQLGRIVASVYESGYLDTHKSYKMSFVKGLFQGLGGAMGATILVALVLWVLSLFSQVPLVSRFTESIRNTVTTQKSQ